MEEHEEDRQDDRWIVFPAGLKLRRCRMEELRKKDELIGS